MKEDAFRGWLQRRYPKPQVAASYLSYAQTLENAFGDLDGYVDEQRIDALLERLRYSMADGRANKPAPAELSLQGNPYNTLSNLRTGLRTYQLFREDQRESFPQIDPSELVEHIPARPNQNGRLFELERHLQESLRGEIKQLEPGLNIIDGGVERAVASGFIDILARDADDALVVIELKAGIAKREAIGQILGYMGDLRVDEPGANVRGILVASGFDKSCRGAVAVVSNLELIEYCFRFNFQKPE
jgi:endonuclease